MTAEITEEITTYLGKKLFESFNNCAETASVEFAIDRQPYAFKETQEYREWLNSPTGIHAVKLAMVRLEFNYHIHSNRYQNTRYECAFFDDFNRKSVKSSLEFTAILLAAYHALNAKAEDVKHRVDSNKEIPR